MRNIQPYHYYTNPPNVDSADFAYVLAWLKLKCAQAGIQLPDAKLARGEVTRIPGLEVRPTLSLQWQRPGLDYTCEQDVVQLLNSPEVALVELKAYFGIANPPIEPFPEP